MLKKLNLWLNGQNAIKILRSDVCFHQYKIVECYIAKRPKLPASQELANIVKLLAHSDKESFIGSFE